MIKRQYFAATGVLAATALTGCHAGMTRSAKIMTPAGETGVARTAAAKTSVARNMDRQIVNAEDGGNGDYQLGVLRARIDRNPSDVAARLEIAERYQVLGFPEVALEHVRLLTERMPDSEDAFVGLAKIERAADRSADAERALVAFAARHEASARLWAWIGLLRDDMGDWKSGETAHRKALALAPDHDDLHNNLGFCLLQQGRKEEAAAEFSAALKLNPRSVIARNNLGTSLNLPAKEAVLHLQSVTDPASAHSNLAAALIDAGRYDEARKELAAALSYNRQHSAALQNLELLAQLDGKPAELKSSARPAGKWAQLAVATWRRIRGIFPESAESKGEGSTNGTDHAVAARK